MPIRRPCDARRHTSLPATSCRSCSRSACRCRSRRRRCRCIARCARSTRRRTCSFTTSATSTSSAPRPRSSCARRARTVTLRPIAGTRPRGATREADEAYASELAADEKELAEHVMLLDLGRNDVGRVAATGSVRVTERMAIERYSHVMHIVSGVEGTLRPGLTALDVLRAAFPAGTVSGAPKVRAMEIIDELEPTRRGVYAGAVGYLIPGRHGPRDRDPHGGAQGPDAVRAGRRGHRARLDSGVGMARKRRTRRGRSCVRPKWCNLGWTGSNKPHWRFACIPAPRSLSSYASRQVRRYRR